MNNKNLRPYLPFIFAIILASGILIGLNLDFGKGNHPSSEKKFFSIGFERYDKLGDIINYIMDAYVDSLDRDDLTQEAIVNLLENLDPHSSYIPASAFREMNDPLMGSFDGIGIEFNMVTDTVVVINPIPGGPSESVGLRAGDRIIQVDGEVIAGVKMNTRDVVRRLKGPKGTKVDVSVHRRGLNDLLSFTITRDKIPSYSLDISYMIDEKTGYIKLGQFSATTHQEFKQAMDKLKRSGMEQMILDLRGNGGGFLDASIQLADELLKPGSLIVYTEGKSRPRTQVLAKRNGGFESQPLVVLIDEWSASASEIVAGAVQDHDRGIIIGRRSFGKGLVQEQVQLNDGSAIRLTVARYFTPSGRSIQKPYDNGSEEYFADLMHRLQDGELDNFDSIRNNDTLKFSTTGGRTVYGGGGITPDIFIPLQRAERTSYYMKVANMGLIYRFAFDYSDSNRQSLKKYSDAADFVANFQISRNLMSSFFRFAENNGVAFDEESYNGASNLIQSQIKAYIGRNMFGSEAFFPVLNQNDLAIREALDVLKSGNLMSYLNRQN
jgi:carboxyl-terminal processing protease